MNEKQLRDRNIITKYNEYDVRYIDDILAAGAQKTGEIEEGESCHHKIKGKPYLVIDGIRLSPAINTAVEVCADNSLAACSCGGTFADKEGVYVCMKCGKIHEDYE